MVATNNLPGYNKYAINAKQNDINAHTFDELQYSKFSITIKLWKTERLDCKAPLLIISKVKI